MQSFHKQTILRLKTNIKVPAAPFLKDYFTETYKSQTPLIKYYLSRTNNTNTAQYNKNNQQILTKHYFLRIFLYYERILDKYNATNKLNRLNKNCTSARL